MINECRFCKEDIAKKALIGMDDVLDFVRGVGLGFESYSKVNATPEMAM